jgi:hypothetical protein
MASDAIADAVTIIDSYASASQNALVAGAGGGVGALPAESLCEAPVSDVIGDALTTIELGTVQAAIATPNATADAIVSSVTGTSITDGLFVETCGNSLLEASVASLDATGQVQEVTAAALLTAPVATMQLSSEAPLLSGDAITNIDAACVSVALLESIPSGSALQVLDITEPAILQAVAPISSICPMAAAASTNVLTCSATGTAIVLPDMGAITIKCLAPDAVSIVTTDITCTANASAEASEAAVFGSADIVAPTTDSVAAAAAPLPIEDPVPVGITVTIDADCQAYVPAVLGCAGIAPEASDVTIAAKEPEFSGDAILSVEVAISSAQAMVAVPSANIELDILAASGSAQALSDISWQLSSNAVCSDAAQVTVITLIPMTYSPELKFAAYLMCYEQQTATSTQEHKRSAIVFVDNKADIVAFIPDTQYLAHLMQYEQQTGLDYHEHKDSIITYIEGASAVGIKTATGGNRILEALTNIKYTP